MLLRTWLIFWKEFIQIKRDPRLIGVVIGLPLVTLILYGYAFNLDVKHLPLAVYDQDRSPTSRNLINAFSRNEYFDVVDYPLSYQAITHDIDSGKALVGLVIPVNFAKDLAVGRTAQVLIILDGSDSTTATSALNYANSIVVQYSAGITLAALQRQGVIAGRAVPVDNRARFWYNPELKSSYFLVPGLIALILSSLSSLLTSVTVARERERGTIELLDVSPVMPVELIIGKLVPYVLIALGDVVLIMIAAVLLFHVPLRGDPLLVILSALVFLLCVLGLGIFISVNAKTQQLAQTIASLTTQLPSVFLSGFVFPISSMPLVVQWFTAIVPATHFIAILRTIFLKGGGFSLIWAQFLILLVMGLAIITFSARRFKKKL